MKQRGDAVLVLGCGSMVREVGSRLGACGADVRLVEDEGAAVEVLLGAQPCLVVLDFTSAAGQALRFYAALRTVSVSTVRTELPVAALMPESGTGAGEQVERAAPEGFVCVLQVPLTAAQLQDLCALYERISGGQQPPAACEPADDCMVMSAVQIAEDFGLEPEDVTTLYRRMMITLPQELDKGYRAVTEGRLADVAGIAHSMAGSFLDMVSYGPAQVARRIERQARSGGTADLEDLWCELDRQCRCVMRVISRRLE
ncbi:hypothetical protein Dde_2679 [Oleidesulfovibrio alaskensis G20]|jgi:hypothetical protein|uniref:HPt domain-containing protein n=1 Tax=Oleidesulfovibrio alaskensis (strain ATCC BAA-1058 / DSM 17464 / G20) TaxID=207559 RepID=Q30XX1_OLEA2|nr:hypothetical protein [Oleidesulfovibrio alaskensis]ABB39475.1 hypothetical protein Dde_2679 [Oleidesulfovibrio alaskensis G20]MBG0772453.1 hypothetical protein [Oleidesulfovibrio alaskensis]